MSFPLWSNSLILLNPSGKIQGTDYSYPANEWMSFKIIADIDNSRWDVYLDGEKIVDGVSMVANQYQTKDMVRFTMIERSAKTGGQPRGGFSLDNTRFYRLIDVPAVTSAAFIKAGAEVASSVIPSDAASVKLYMSDKYNSVTDSDVVVLVDGAETPHGGASLEGNAVVVGLPSGIAAGAQVDVVLKGTLAISDVGVKPVVQDTLYSFYVSDEENLYVSQPQVSVEGSVATAVVTVANGVNTDRAVSMVIAAYEGNRLVDIKLETFDIFALSSEDKDISLTVPAGADSVKAMVWDSFETLRPITNANSKPIS